VDNIVRTYLDTRNADERFLDTVRRVGISPFKERLYAAA
jgi:sulfite reductase (NADPH) hemoprotein beta-component